MPPKGAFNDGKFIHIPGVEAVQIGPTDEVRGKIQQGGCFYYALCGRCNNNTGNWYGQSYIDWAFHGYKHLVDTSGRPELVRIYHGYPLRIIKQIVSMFLSIDSIGLGDANPYLRSFVLSRELSGLPPEYRVWTYYTDSDRLRYCGISMQTHRSNFDHKYFAEIAFPPFGYVLTIDSAPPDWRLADISWFAKYRYHQWTDTAVHLRKLQVNMAYPGDYRTLQEIENDYRLNSAALPVDPDSMSPETVAEFGFAVDTAMAGLRRRGGKPDRGFASPTAI